MQQPTDDPRRYFGDTSTPRDWPRVPFWFSSNYSIWNYQLLTPHTNTFFSWKYELITQNLSKLPRLFLNFLSKFVFHDVSTPGKHDFKIPKLLHDTNNLNDIYFPPPQKWNNLYHIPLTFVCLMSCTCIFDVVLPHGLTIFLLYIKNNNVIMLSL